MSLSRYKTTRKDIRFESGETYCSAWLYLAILDGKPFTPAQALENGAVDDVVAPETWSSSPCTSALEASHRWRPSSARSTSAARSPKGCTSSGRSSSPRCCRPEVRS